MTLDLLSIRLARPDDATCLPGIERSAGALFRTLRDLAWVADEPLATPQSFLPLIAAGTIWVADHAGAGLVGELRAEVFEGTLHILELAVAAQFQRRGVGRSLLDAAAAAARNRGLQALTLTTFRHVAWNGPFYARYGFVEIPVAALSARLGEIVRTEEARGLPNRCAMGLAL